MEPPRLKAERNQTSLYLCRSADEAALFVRKLQALLQEIGTCSGQMAEVGYFSFDPLHLWFARWHLAGSKAQYSPNDTPSPLIRFVFVSLCVLISISTQHFPVRLFVCTLA